MELDTLLQQIDSLKKEAESLQPVKPEYERVFWEKFRLEFNFNSNHIEGNTLTYGQTQLLLLFDRVSGENTGREIEEMKAHDVALSMIQEIANDKEGKLTEKLIKEINKLILVRPYYNKAITSDRKPTRRLITPGNYKKYPNSVLLQTGEMFFYASPEETPALMGDLIDWYNTEKANAHAVELAAQFHYKMVRIHPFDDSNGRTTRLMMNFILMQNGYAPIVIESSKKEEYLTALNKADLGNIDDFIEYISGITLKWQNLYLKAIRGERISEPGDFEKEVEIIKRNAEAGKKAKIKKSEKLITELFNQSLFPLIKRVNAKLSLLNPLFKKTTIEFSMNGNNFSESNIENLISRINHQLPGLLIHEQIEITYRFQHFIGTEEKRINLIFCLIFKLSDYSYEINLNNDNSKIIRKKYGQHLTEPETENFAEMAARTALDEIKNRGIN
ncbi:MAG: Fic family protein [Bacteroidetes bacterium]|nr:Fic family protein [Bacteroidota bacterium]